MGGLLRDLRFGARLLVKQPTFTLAAVLTVGLGIAAAGVVLGAADALIVHPWRVLHDTDRLVWFFETNGKLDLGRDGVALGNLSDWRAQATSFDHIVAMTGQEMDLSTTGRPDRGLAAVVSADYFAALGVPMQLGTAFAPGATDHVAVISDDVWRRRFGGDRSTIGKSIQLDGEPYLVVGIAPPGFTFPKGRTDVWLPLVLTPEAQADREHRTVGVVGRLKPGVPIDQAQSEMTTIAKRLAGSFPKTNAGWDVTLQSVDQMFVGPRRAPLLLLLGAVMFVLLIGCANISNLLLARATARGREVAVRLAVGATAGRVIRQLITESILLAVLGGAAGVLLAWWGIDLLVSALPSQLVWEVPRLADIRLNGEVLAAASGAVLACGLLFGLAPALRAVRGDVPAALKDGDRAATSRGGKRLRDALIIGELGLAMVLLMAAAMSGRAFLRQLDAPLGFHTHGVLTARVSLPPRRYKDSEATLAFYRRLEARLQALPGATGAAVASEAPLDGRGASGAFTIEGEELPDSAAAPYSLVTIVSPGYFDLLGIALLTGRNLANEDTTTAPGVVVVSESLARRWFPRGAVGRRIRWVDDHSVSEIVGVVGDVKDPPNRGQGRARIYMPHSQVPFPAMTLLLAGPNGLAGALRDAVVDIDPEQPLDNIESMDSLISQTRAPIRIVAVLFGMLAGLALVLAALGTYGVMYYSVSQRMHEFGIRLALGASPADVVRLVLRRGLAVALAGVAAGTLGALLLGQSVPSLVEGVGDLEPGLLALVAGLLFGTAMIACWLPARRAARLDPSVALRYE